MSCFEIHPAPHRRTRAILAAHQIEKARIVARCKAFGAIAEAMAHYDLASSLVLTSSEPTSRWELLGTYAGIAASADAAWLRS